MSEHNSPEAFFRAQRDAFALTLKNRPGVAGIDAVLPQARDSFDRNVEIQSEGQPPVDCGKGCSACCTLRVTATAPEVYTIAAFVQATTPTLRRRCAFVERGVCLIHRVRPLACRGHASHSRQACADAAAGRRDSVPHSGPHRVVRLLVQSALQAALRDHGLAWGAYELNHALALALDDHGSTSLSIHRPRSP